MDAFHRDLPKRLDELVARHVDDGEAGGLAWLASRRGEVVAGTAGVLTRGEPAPVELDSLFRIASVTKPLTSTAALVLVEECRLRLDDPVDDLLPELADRRVLVDPRGPIDGETVPAERSITVRDLLTMRCGLGMDLTAPWPQPLLDAMGELGLAPGAPEPGVPPAPDEWMRRIGTLPLLRQPGEGWLYNTATDILGVLVARAAGTPFDRFLAERVLEPVGMHDTAFWTSTTDRLGTSYSVDGATAERSVYDRPDGGWASPPSFPSGAAGLVSTVHDLAAFGQVLLDGGRLPDGSRLLGRATVEAMTTDQVGGEAGITPDGSVGWGFGVGVQRRRTGVARSVGSYGWDGGLGSSWAVDPAEDLVGVVLSTDSFAGSDALPHPLADFWTTVYASLD